MYITLYVMTWYILADLNVFAQDTLATSCSNQINGCILSRMADDISDINYKLEASFRERTSLLQVYGPICTVFSGTSCYVLNTHKVNWATARDSCSAQRGRLAEVYNRQTNELLKLAVKDIELEVWLGATDAEEEGVWKWVSSGNQVVFADWYPAEPSGGRENCLEIWHINDAWNDKSCGEARIYFCEFVLF